MKTHAARIASRCLLAAAAVAALAGSPLQVEAHGWLQEPKSRNWLMSFQHHPEREPPPDFYNPMSLNKVGKLLNNATCGATQLGDTSFEVGGKYASRTIVKTYKAGDVITSTVQIFSNHWGWFDMRLCPLRSPSSAAEVAAFSEECLEANKLQVVSTDTGIVDTSNNRVWLYDGAPGIQYIVNSTWRLPAGVTARRAVLQWRYMTGHMCYLPGVDVAKMMLVQPEGNRPCEANHTDPYVLPSEKFWNCADIKIKL